MRTSLILQPKWALDQLSLLSIVTGVVLFVSERYDLTTTIVTGTTGFLLFIWMVFMSVYRPIKPQLLGAKYEKLSTIISLLLTSVYVIYYATNWDEMRSWIGCIGISLIINSCKLLLPRSEQ